MGERVTVAVASCNNSNYIRRCIDSILLQKYKELEIIIVDDGSKDNSLQIIAEYDDERIQVISKENQGLSSSRQRALEQATGVYICFIDADDYLKDDYIMLLYQKIRKENADICVGGTQFWSEAGQLLKKETDVFSYGEEYITKSISKEMLLEEYCVLARRYYMSDSWNKMYRVDFLRNTGVSFCIPKGMNGSDSAFNHKILLHKPRITTIKECVYCHVVYKKSAVHRKNKQMQKAYQTLLKQVINECKITDNTDLMKEQIPFLYLGGLRKTFEDVNHEYRGRMLWDEYKKIIKASEVFLLENGLDIRHTTKVFSKSIKIFLVILKTNSPLLIWLYIEIRHFLLSIKEGET